MTPDVIKKIRALGYSVGIAHGGVEVEQDALASAQEKASPEQITIDAAEITTRTLSDLQAANKLPTNEKEHAELVARISTSALRGVKHGRDEAVAFHAKALSIAKAMPTMYVVSGHGIDCVYFALDDTTGKGAALNDQEIVASLLNEKAHAERVKQAKAPAKPEK
jgi:hypothetical protein